MRPPAINNFWRKASNSATTPRPQHIFDNTLGKDQQPLAPSTPWSRTTLISAAAIQLESRLVGTAHVLQAPWPHALDLLLRQTALPLHLP